ncbi:pimeloyl-ACP methyl ester carboxylesterase [Kitasatospora sp. MAP12-15]|uniref:alpha/beta fold hydrolase n=1 Tax=unclassified Kitasatospora TaxID=2633591 RepID=UPI0024736F02|nr:alpha/beta hydrolase [Kitasatospora sp. MAP12-44]MDH6110659.1 pimeloyl-ACP methyl ester carboxylesterase [Kitasatospora sp. MAP12-44]
MAATAAYQEFGFAVPGGELAVLRWPAADPAAPTVLALHGITGNAASWTDVAARLAGRVTLLAPDLRGRGASGSVAGPFGLARHADDVALLIGSLGLGPVLLVGHSMGAWVTALTAVRHPALVRRVLLVDGAVSFPLPEGVPVDQALAAVLGPALARLSMTFDDREAYHAFWRAHPGLGKLEALGSLSVREFAERDLVGTPPGLRSACADEAIRADGADLLLDPAARLAIRQLPCPAELLWAERGLLDEPKGLYDQQRLAAAELDADRPAVRLVPDTNHYSIVMGPAGAAVVAERLLAAL